MKCVFAIFLFSSTIFPLAGQLTLPLSVISVAGDAIEGNGIKLDFTLGEQVADLIKDDLLYINQGFQQSHFRNLDLTVPTFETESKGISVYPNPFDQVIYVSNPELFDVGGIIFRNVVGQIFLEINDVRLQQPIKAETLPPGIYWMTIYFKTEAHKSIKLIKL